MQKMDLQITLFSLLGEDGNWIGSLSNAPSFWEEFHNVLGSFFLSLKEKYSTKREDETDSVALKCLNIIGIGNLYPLLGPTPPFSFCGQPWWEHIRKWHQSNEF